MSARRWRMRDALADAAPAVAALRDEGVRLVEGVALGAVRLSCVLRREADTAKNILAPRDRLQVIGVHAPPNPAKVVEGQTGRYRPTEHLEGVSVGDDLSLAVPELAVSAGDQPGCPEPATVGAVAVDVLPEPVGSGDSLQALALLPSLVMQRAEALRVVLLRAASSGALTRRHTHQCIKTDRCFAFLTVDITTEFNWA